MMRNRPLKITIWATTPGADLLAFCRYLETREDADAAVFMPDPEGFKAQAAWKLAPLKSPLFKRGAGGHARALRRKSDVTVADNAVPFLKTSPKLFILWHGFGWRMDDIGFMKRCISARWGDPGRPNPNFKWQCFGGFDFRYRGLVSGIHEENLAVLGSAFHDEIGRPFDKEALAPFYPFDVLGRKTVLLAPTWHYGGIFPPGEDEGRVLEALIGFLDEEDANLMLRMHDAWRYEKPFVRRMLALGQKHPHVAVKFKDRCPDNSLDLRLADVLITNFSSIANSFYATGRPSLHIYPVADPESPYPAPRVWAGKVVRRKIENARLMWKLPLEENGGLIVHNESDLFAGLRRALDDPDCCREKSRAFLDKYMLGADGKSCERIWDAIERMAET